jgi:hypothetical protein
MLRLPRLPEAEFCHDLALPGLFRLVVMVPRVRRGNPRQEPTYKARLAWNGLGTRMTSHRFTRRRSVNCSLRSGALIRA